MKALNDKKICIILCANNEIYLGEALHYVSNLIVPAGYELEVISVPDAKSITSGYNEMMNYSKAKYKIYIHQDVFIIKKDILIRLLHIFENKNIGMIGMVGAPKMSPNGIMWNVSRVGKIYSCNVYSNGIENCGDISDAYREVEAIDGLFMATQYDIPWREDIFKHWDFYDVSQSLEFIKAGYKVVVPKMDEPWIIHDAGVSVLNNSYYEDRLLFLNEYKNML